MTTTNWLRSIVIGSLALAAVGCDSTNPQQPPIGTRMIPFAGDHFADTGIRPDPDAPEPSSNASGGIIIEWRSIDPADNDGAAVGGYHIYRSDSSDRNGTPLNFVRIARMPLGAPGGDTIFSDVHVRQNVRYSYCVTAYAKSDLNLESVRSDTVSFTLLDRPIPSEPIGDIELPTGSPLRFRFSGPGYVAFRLDEVLPENETVILSQVWRHSGQILDFSNPYVEYAGPAIERGKRYRWRVDRIIQGLPQANASRWVTFSVK